MRIQHNIAAMNSYRNLSSNNKAVSKNLEKLSSGYRINRAGDDAAGLAISEKMRAQVTGLKTAQKNAKDGISLIQTAEGALTEVHSMLNRMVELADQSANGTYDDSTDRANLQKEFDALRSEVDRISKATNFNGISLLDGSVSVAKGIKVDTILNPATTTMSGKLGTVGGAVDGELTADKAAVDYQGKFYIGEITNTDAGTKDIVFNYNDNAGGPQTITLTVAAGKTASMDDIFNALSAGTTNANITGVVDTGTAFAGGAEDGKFSDLYTIAKDGSNVLTITAKADQSTVSSTNGNGKLDGSKLGTISFDYTDFAAADITAAEAKLTHDVAGTGTPISLGSVAGTERAHSAKVAGNYQLAKAELTLTGTGASMHNQGITVGDKTYVIKSSGKDLSDDVPANAVIINVDDADAATDVATALATAITGSESTNGGYVATAAAGKLTIEESTNRGAKVLANTPGFTPGKGDTLIKQEDFETASSAANVTGNITIDSANLANGSTISVGGKTFMLSNDKNQAAEAGQIKVNYKENATSTEIATALASAMTGAGLTGVTSAGDKVNFANTASTTNASAVGAGLRLQIGDTSDSYNQISVQVGNMDCASLGIDASKINIDKQQSAADAVKVLKNSINSVSSTRGDLGALQNRLEHTINNLSVMTENIQDAESTIRDVDVAEEMMAYTKNNILVQSSQAMLAQANQLPQGVLQLLG